MGKWDRWGKQKPPQNGEIVVSCGHGTTRPILLEAFNRRNPTGWVEVDPPLHMASPGGGNLTARWVTACQACLTAAGGDWRRVELRDHFVWDGDDTAPDPRAATEETLAELSDRELVDVAREYLPQFRGMSREDVADALNRGNLRVMKGSGR